ncbi:MAG: hypothetical protein GEU79_10825 [Acidimicrobiia bacterium]|nr:hypothetical protein [Acidimicrobiia bacterium]
MRFRLGMIIGGGIGYVLGARAGRQRYEQIASRWEQIRSHPAAEELTGQATNVVDAGRKAVSSGLRQGSDKLRDVADNGADPTT